MHFSVKQSKAIAMALSLTLVFQLTSCGTLLYPERRGQDGGKIDPVVAVLDGVGLLFFLIPGIIAFGVDFGTGAIYLPPGGRSEAPPADDDEEATEPVRIVYVDPANISIESIEAAIENEMGMDVNLADASLSVMEHDSIRLLSQEVASANHAMQNTHRTARVLTETN